jgi:hypothetical protein
MTTGDDVERKGVSPFFQLPLEMRELIMYYMGTLKELMVFRTLCKESNRMVVDGFIRWLRANGLNREGSEIILPWGAEEDEVYFLARRCDGKSCLAF